MKQIIALTTSLVLVLAIALCSTSPPDTEGLNATSTIEATATPAPPDESCCDNHENSQDDNTNLPPEEEPPWIDPIEIVFPPEHWETARCIRAYESEGIPTKVGDHGDSRGWFQINRRWHEYRFKQYGGWDMAFDEMVNTQVAWEIVQEYGWSQWSTYRLCS